MIAILGGVFDPVHFGHLKPVYELLRQPEIEQLRLLPCYLPPHKEKVTTASHRLAMLKLLEQPPNIIIDTREIDNKSVSSTVDSLCDFRAELGDKKSLAFVLGADVFQTITQWRQYVELPRLANLIVTSRPGHTINAEHPLLKQCGGWSSLSTLGAIPAGRICLFKNKLFDISSSAVRSMFAASEQPRYQMPGVVLDYIRNNKLYGY